jgi:hypothetical protein
VTDDEGLFMSRTPEITTDEMRRIIATDIGFEPDQIQGVVIVVAVERDDTPGAVMPVVRADVPNKVAAYMMSSALNTMLMREILGKTRSDRDDFDCDYCDPDAPKAACGHEAGHDQHDWPDVPGGFCSGQPVENE